MAKKTRRVCLTTITAVFIALLQNARLMSQKNHRNSWLRANSVLVLVLAVCEGCNSKPPLFPVKGQVVYKDNGEPFKGATAVVLESVNPPYTRARSELDGEGKFELATEQREGVGALAGKHRVSISYITRDGAYVQDKLAKQLNTKYFEFSTSGIEVEIQPGQSNDLKIEIDRAGK